MLLENEAIADVAVIGVDSRVEETELPRYVLVVYCSLRTPVSDGIPQSIYRSHQPRSV